MTRAEIIAELRRSAIDDVHPAYQMSQEAWDALDSLWHHGDRIASEENTQYRTFVLIAAHALEDE